MLGYAASDGRTERERIPPCTLGQKEQALAMLARQFPIQDANGIRARS